MAAVEEEDGGTANCIFENIALVDDDDDDAAMAISDGLIIQELIAINGELTLGEP